MYATSTYANLNVAVAIARGVQGQEVMENLLGNVENKFDEIFTLYNYFFPKIFPVENYPLYGNIECIIQCHGMYSILNLNLKVLCYS